MRMRLVAITCITIGVSASFFISANALIVNPFTTDLHYGETNPAVRMVQIFLNEHGFAIAKSGAGSPGDESDYFGHATRLALTRFQSAHELPATGFFGSLTRAVINTMGEPAQLPSAETENQSDTTTVPMWYQQFNRNAPGIGWFAGFGGGGGQTAQSPSLITPTFGPFADMSHNFTDGSFTIGAPTSNSVGVFSFTTSNSLVATVSGTTITLAGAGMCTITATQAANGGYSGGSITANLSVAGACADVNICSRAGTCQNVASTPGGPVNTFQCTCNSSYSGTHCELSDLMCRAGSGNECENGGTCNATGGGGQCSCTECWRGDRCELPVTDNNDCA